MLQSAYHNAWQPAGAIQTFSCSSKWRQLRRPPSATSLRTTAAAASLFRPHTPTSLTSRPLPRLWIWACARVLALQVMTDQPSILQNVELLQCFLSFFFCQSQVHIIIYPFFLQSLTAVFPSEPLIFQSRGQTVSNNFMQTTRDNEYLLQVMHTLIKFKTYG